MVAKGIQYRLFSGRAKMIMRNGLLAVLVIAVLASFIDAEPPQKVVGGTPTYPGELPYQVSLRFLGKHYCGGAIIGPRHVLTSASCIQPVPNLHKISVITGSIKPNEGEAHEIKDAIFHSGWRSTLTGSPHDIAIIALKKEIPFNFYQNKINLPPAPVTPPAVAVVSGWGAKVNQYDYVAGLSKAQVFVMSNPDCHTALNNTSVLWINQICTLSTAGVGICTGDEGGPLVYNSCLVGIVPKILHCGQGFPDVYTSVYHYLDWINHYMKTT